MKIELLNYNPFSLAFLINELEKHLPHDIGNAPITITLSYSSIINGANNSITYREYDYLTADGKSADFSILSPDEFEEEAMWNNSNFTYDGNTYYLTLISETTSK